MLIWLEEHYIAGRSSYKALTGTVYSRGTRLTGIIIYTREGRELVYLALAEAS